MGTLHTKRIAFNTLFLYVRMLILMFVAFYTSRVLLKELGINDFGLYGIVGGIVAIFSSLRGLFAQLHNASLILKWERMIRMV